MTHPHAPRLEEAIGSPADAARIRSAAPASFDAASGFWQSAFEGPHLSPRCKGLVLVALHGAASTINEQAIARHVGLAKAAGASDADILDVLLSIVGLANHALYFAVPVLMEELQAAGRTEEAAMPALQPELQAIKDDFVKTRGFWNEQRDQLARLMPDYFKALSALSTEPWKSGSLSPRERELVYIAIDSSITHMHDAGLRMHIRNALRHGATRDEILEVFQLVSLMGTEGYIVGCQALARQH